MDREARAETRATEARGYIDDLVERLGGTAIEVTEDRFEPCTLQDEDSGLLHSYSLRFTIEPGTARLLEGKIADEMQADGWTVRRDAPNRGVISVRFLRGTFSIGAKLAEDIANGTAGGSGGCVQ